MPEAPEVYLLACALKGFGFSCKARGKHLILKDMHDGQVKDFSFGLAGKIKVDEKFHITKITHPELPSGDVQPYDKAQLDEKLGVEWMRMSEEDAKALVMSWCFRKKQLGALLLDQKEVSGIGVAWASEILAEAKIGPGEKAHTMECFGLVEPLAKAMVTVRDRVVETYMDFLGRQKDMRKCVNEWFENLYGERKAIMKVYKKGRVEKVAGREFYIADAKP